MAKVETMPVPPGPDRDTSRWQREYDDYIHGRLDRAQEAARAWLSIMTTLTGLFSTVIVISGPKTVSDVRGGMVWRVGVLAGAFVVFVVAFVALLEGLRATWGGLGIGRSPTEPLTVRAELAQMWSPRAFSVDDFAATTPEQFRDQYLKRSNKARGHLHRSRILGLLAAVGAGLLALAVLANGAFYT